MRRLEDKLNFINDAKKSNIAKINIESINMGRVTTTPILLKKIRILENSNILMNTKFILLFNKLYQIKK